MLISNDQSLDKVNIDQRNDHEFSNHYATAIQVSQPLMYFFT